MDAGNFKSKQQASQTKLMQDVMAILEDIKINQDQALLKYTETFDGQKLEKIKVDSATLKAAYDTMDENVKEALMTARDRIIDYEKSLIHHDKDLGEFKYIYHPLERVGIYIPGGQALYPSSVLMTVIPAQVAGVKEIHVTTPTFQENNITFATLYLLGVKDVYTIGGAQAIGALAYGTETIPKVDKIVGPGNAYVAMAKRLVFGDVGIDSIAGPSEILLYIDETANLEAVIYDIFAQAEHDVNARTFLLSESQELIDQINAKMPQMLESQSRKTIIEGSLANNHHQIVDKQVNLIKLINEIAAEHVSIQHTDQDAIVKQIKYAGAVFKGQYSPEAIGDYIAGPSHVLPTSGTARFSHGLNVNDFLTSHAIIELSQESYQKIVDPAALIAETEKLYAHQASLLVRKEEEIDD